MGGVGFTGVKVIIGGISALALGVDVGGVAAFCGRFAVVSVHALNGRDVEKQTVSGAADDMDEKPRNRVGIGRVDVGDGFTGDLAAIGQLPTGTGEMAADDFALIIFQFRVGRFERPRELAIGSGLAGVDLRSGRVSEQHDVLAGRSLNRVWNLGRRNHLGAGGGKAAYHDGDDRCGMLESSGARDGESHREDQNIMIGTTARKQRFHVI
jgi:hypothetical protein